MKTTTSKTTTTTTTRNGRTFHYVGIKTSQTGAGKTHLCTVTFDDDGTMLIGDMICGCGNSGNGRFRRTARIVGDATAVTCSRGTSYAESIIEQATTATTPPTSTTATTTTKTNNAPNVGDTITLTTIITMRPNYPISGAAPALETKTRLVATGTVTKIAGGFVHFMHGTTECRYLIGADGVNRTTAGGRRSFVTFDNVSIERRTATTSTTALENTALVSIFAAPSVRGNGNNEPRELADVSIAWQAEGKRPSSLPGVVASLNKKGLAVSETYGPFDTVALTDAGVAAIFAHLDNLCADDEPAADERDNCAGATDCAATTSTTATTATTTKTYRNPNTGTVWTMPRDAARYGALVGRSALDWSCEHGHFACAVFAGGPCSDEHRPAPKAPRLSPTMQLALAIIANGDSLDRIGARTLTALERRGLVAQSPSDYRVWTATHAGFVALGDVEFCTCADCGDDDPATRASVIEIAESNAHTAIDQAHTYPTLSAARDAYEQNTTDTIDERHPNNGGAYYSVAHAAFARVWNAAGLEAEHDAEFDRDYCAGESKCSSTKSDDVPRYFQIVRWLDSLAPTIHRVGRRDTKRIQIKAGDARRVADMAERFVAWSRDVAAATDDDHARRDFVSRAGDERLPAAVDALQAAPHSKRAGELVRSELANAIFNVRSAFGGYALRNDDPRTVEWMATIARACAGDSKCSSTKSDDVPPTVTLYQDNAGGLYVGDGGGDAIAIDHPDAEQFAAIAATFAEWSPDHRFMYPENVVCAEDLDAVATFAGGIVSIDEDSAGFEALRFVGRNDCERGDDGDDDLCPCGEPATVDMGAAGAVCHKCANVDEFGDDPDVVDVTRLSDADLYRRWQSGTAGDATAPAYVEILRRCGQTAADDRFAAWCAVAAGRAPLDPRVYPTTEPLPFELVAKAAALFRENVGDVTIQAARRFGRLCIIVRQIDERGDLLSVPMIWTWHPDAEPATFSGDALADDPEWLAQRLRNLSTVALTSLCGASSAATAIAARAILDERNAAEAPAAAGDRCDVCGYSHPVYDVRDSLITAGGICVCEFRTDPDNPEFDATHYAETIHKWSDGELARRHVANLRDAFEIGAFWQTAADCTRDEILDRARPGLRDHDSDRAAEIVEHYVAAWIVDPCCDDPSNHSTDTSTGAVDCAACGESIEDGRDECSGERRCPSASSGARVGPWTIERDEIGDVHLYDRGRLVAELSARYWHARDRFDRIPLHVVASTLAVRQQAPAPTTTDRRYTIRESASGAYTIAGCGFSGRLTRHRDGWRLLLSADAETSDPRTDGAIDVVIMFATLADAKRWLRFGHVPASKMNDDQIDDVDIAADFERWRDENPPKCPHGDDYADCDPCMVAGDLAFDAARESGKR